jgi:CspA family cold shock protein
MNNFDNHLLHKIFSTVEKEKFQGTVKFFNSEKGFGFIKSDTSKEEVFVHATGIIDEIKENDKVEFELQQGRKGMNAVNVVILR